MEKHPFTELLAKEVTPALGCTAPVAVALAAARCRAEITAPPCSMEVILSPGIYKNGWGVAVPGTDQKGNDLGAALGLFGGDYRLGLEVLNTAGPADMAKAKAFLEAAKVQVGCSGTEKGIYIEAVVKTAAETVRTIIKDTHSTIVSVEVNGKPIAALPEKEQSVSKEQLRLTYDEILDYIENVPYCDIAFLKEGALMNLDLARFGLENPIGLSSGRALLLAAGGESLPADPPLRSKILTCAAADARMGGSLLPAMSTVGSGNQGITAIIPAAVWAESQGLSDEQLCRGLALSHLTTYFVKQYAGRISSTCLCAVASCAGSAAAITWLRGGTAGQIHSAIKNAVSALAGMLCDGAKNSCALKMGVAAYEAFTFANLALAGAAVGYYDGIAGDSLESTLQHLGQVTACTKEPADNALVAILMAKQAGR